MEQNKCSTEETKLQSDFEGQVAVSLHKKKKKKGGGKFSKRNQHTQRHRGIEEEDTFAKLPELGEDRSYISECLDDTEVTL